MPTCPNKTPVPSLIINIIPRSQVGAPGDCLEGTRTADLEDIVTWIRDDVDTRCVCWLNNVWVREKVP